MTSKRNGYKKSSRLTIVLVLIIICLSAAIIWNIRNLFEPEKIEQAYTELKIQIRGNKIPDTHRKLVILEPTKQETERPGAESADIQSTEKTADQAETAPFYEKTSGKTEAAEMPDEEIPKRRIQETAAVDDTYFQNTVFIGNSRTEGFKLYSGLNQGTYLYGTGATVNTVLTKPSWNVDGKRVPILDAAKAMNPDRIYVMLGINELGWPRINTFKEVYGDVVDRLKEDHPNAEIVLQSILPVTKKQADRGSYVNNERIQKFNQAIIELTDEKQCWYLDVQTAVTDEQGFLREELSFDGVHLNRDGCRLWHEYLRTHTI